MTVFQIHRDHFTFGAAAVAAILSAGGCVWQPQGGNFGPVLIPPTAASPAVKATDRAELPLAVSPVAADTSAFRDPSAQVRLEALQGWRDRQGDELPIEAVDLRSDPDPRVRAAALALLATSGHPQAQEYLTAGLNDHELSVRLSAVAALGEMPTDAARAMLQTLLAHPSELVRAEAVVALASRGQERLVLDAAKDESWRVRLAVAKQLQRFPTRSAAAVAMEMLEDSSAPVQQQAIASIGDWPLDRSGPILLEAMAQVVYSTRKSAAEQLADRWPPAGEFPVDGPPERRQEILDRLRQEFRGQIGFVDEAALAGATAAAGPAPETVARVEHLLRQQAAADLRALGPSAVDALEHLSLDRQQRLPETVYREVLSPLSPAFAAMEDLRSDNAAARRRAAGRLAELASKQPLRRLALARLAELAVAETDPLVWQSVLAAVAADGTEPAIRLAAAAIGHPAPEVRRRACEHLAAHPDPGHAALLLPALNDPHDTVAATAAKALGCMGRMDDTGPLRQLLASANEMVCLEAALALTRLGDDAGEAALERLSYSGDEAVRRRVAAAMGEVPRPAFVPALIRLLDDRQSIRVTALASLPKVAGRDVAGPAGQPAPRMTEQIERWKRWHDQERAGSEP